MRIDGAGFEALMADMEASVRAFMERVRSDPSLWTCARPGKWSVGRHADHIATALTVTADGLEHAERDLRAGVLLTPPLRWPLELLFVGIAVKAGHFPRGGRAPRSIVPGPNPIAEDVAARVGRDLARHRALGERLSAEERDRLWIPSPFMRGWHYRYPEILRLHAVHTRHHARQVDEVARARSRA